MPDTTMQTPQSSAASRALIGRPRHLQLRLFSLHTVCMSQQELQIRWGAQQPSQVRHLTLQHTSKEPTLATKHNINSIASSGIICAMATGLGSRLVMINFLLIFQFLVIAVEVIFFKTKPDNIQTEPAHESPKPSDTEGQSNSWSKGWRKLIWHRGYAWPISNVEIRQSIVPLVSAILGAILVSVAFSGKSWIYPSRDGECNTNLDADISGDGVRMTFWAQIAVLIIISIIGFFHQEGTGIKEVGGGLILIHVSLVIALVVQMGKGTLTSVNAAIGATILDAQNMALQIPLTAKETLAARWQVILLIPAQILGLAVLPILIVRLTKGDFASEDCKCLYFFWWSWLSDCSAFSHSELSVFWVYYSLRWIMFIQSSFHSMYNAEWFHVSEKGERCSKPEPVKYATIQAGYRYKDYPATISWSYMLFALYSLTSMAVAEVTIRDLDLHPSSHIYSVGQIIAIVVAGATIIRAAWSFVPLFNKEDRKSFPDLIFTLLWPGSDGDDDDDIALAKGTAVHKNLPLGSYQQHLGHQGLNPPANPRRKWEDILGHLVRGQGHGLSIPEPRYDLKDRPRL
ncbi:hypothetical protein CC80DRAFT_554872 [Byssothecium circinans]|uniref:Uncharacterized protein n=1 Tax=Byssothecium circinans TaxID=147558 RepID=A0A6A5TBJ4_9PLEO|nr:hypothetical protein CC80DRAFT_554872 [Byssothecium circinans]